MTLKRTMVAAVVVVLGASSGCGSSSDGDSGPTDDRTSAEVSGVHVVALGDSDTTGVGDPTGKGWVGRFGDLVEDELDQPALVDNRAAEGLTSAELLDRVRHDTDLRQSLGEADIVLLGIGGADLNPAEDMLAAGACSGTACFREALASLEMNLRLILREIRGIAPDVPIRAMSLPNAYPGGGDAIPAFITAAISRHEVESERSIVCRTVEAADGRCVDVVRAFNGASSLGNAYARGLMTKVPCCYPSGDGQQRIAQLVFDVTIDDLR